MKLTTIQKGEVAHLKIQLAALNKGFILSKPVMECRYDYVLDDGQTRKRVQIKYADGSAAHCSGAVLVRLDKFHKNHTLLYSADEIDLVLAYLPKVDAIIVLPPEKFANKAMVQIRYELPKNGQKQGVNFYQDFLW